MTDQIIKQKLQDLLLINGSEEGAVEDVAFEIFTEVVELILDLGVKPELMTTYINDVYLTLVNPDDEYEVVEEDELNSLKEEKPYLFDE
jgi:L-ribulose-5-phosphate 3-epimerase UlaE